MQGSKKEIVDTLVKDLTRVDGLNNLKIVIEKILDLIKDIDTKDERYEELLKKVESLEGYIVPFEEVYEVIEHHCLGRPIDPLVVVNDVKSLATVINSEDFNWVTVRFSKPTTGYVVIK